MGIFVDFSLPALMIMIIIIIPFHCSLLSSRRAVPFAPNFRFHGFGFVFAPVISNQVWREGEAKGRERELSLSETSEDLLLLFLVFCFYSGEAVYYRRPSSIACI